MWLPSRTFYNGHDLLPPSSTGKVQRATKTPLRCLHRPQQNVRPGQQGRALQHPSENCSPPPPPPSPRLHSMIRSFHDDMKATIQYEGSMSELFDIRSGVKQGCVLTLTLFGVFFLLLLKHAFGTSTEQV